MSTPQRRGLGRGLELLVGGVGERQELAQIRVDEIAPNARQPRRRFEPEATAGLAESIRHQGLLQPVVVRPRPDGGYELIAGERRWRAAKDAGVESVPALVRDADDRDSLLLALVENVAREQLSAVEEARAYATLVDEFGLSLGERRRARRPLEVVGVEPAAAARVAGRGALDARPRRADGRPRPRRPRRFRTHGEQKVLARRIVAERPLGPRRRACRAGRRREAQAARARRAKVDPALASRVETAATRVTGMAARVTGGRLEIPFADETELEELAEALERVSD